MTATEKFIYIIDHADEPLTISTDRDRHITTARTQHGKLYYYIKHSQQ